LKERISQAGEIRVGSLVARFRKCGKPSRHCVKGHGPSYRSPIPRVEGRTRDHSRQTCRELGRESLANLDLEAIEQRLNADRSERRAALSRLLLRPVARYAGRRVLLRSQGPSDIRHD
jgi:hypothetical protein